MSSPDISSPDRGLKRARSWGLDFLASPTKRRHLIPRPFNIPEATEPAPIISVPSPISAEMYAGLVEREAAKRLKEYHLKFGVHECRQSLYEQLSCLRAAKHSPGSISENVDSYVDLPSQIANIGAGSENISSEREARAGNSVSTVVRMNSADLNSANADMPGAMHLNCNIAPLEPPLEPPFVSDQTPMAIEEIHIIDAEAIRRIKHQRKARWYKFW